MSGNADSKQISTPILSGLPSGVVVTVSVWAPAPGIMLLGAALLTSVSQPSGLRNGMYSPNGTSRVLTYRPWMPDGLTSTATFSWPPAVVLSLPLLGLGLGPGTVESRRARISAWSWAESFSIWLSSEWSKVRSSATLDSPQTIRLGCSAASLALALNSAVSASEALTRWVGFCTLPGWTSAIVTWRTAGNGAVSANASGPDPTAAANAATPSAPSAIRPAVAGTGGAAGPAGSAGSAAAVAGGGPMSSAG